jgi:hypothetical protein
MATAKVDLHVHSKFSHHASEWFLKKLGAFESYAEPEEVYRCDFFNGRVPMKGRRGVPGPGMVRPALARRPGEARAGS